MDHTAGDREIYMKTKISILRDFMETRKKVGVSYQVKGTFDLNPQSE